MKTYEEVKKYVKEKLSEKRFYHSQCVEERCIELAKIYGEDEEKAKMIGIAHDVAKEMSKEEKKEFINKYKIPVTEIEENSTGLLHAKIGAKISEIEFGFTQEMQEAIANHTTGKAGMDMLSKILYIGDSTSKDRTYESAKKLYEMSKKDIEKAILECLNYTIVKCVEEEKIIHPDTIHARNEYYLKK